MSRAERFLGRQRPLRRVEYEKLVELGAFGDERVELVYGRLVERSAHGRGHGYALSKLSKLLDRALLDRANVRAQLPFVAVDESEPEPDIAVLPPGDYLDAHPSRAFLVVEVSDTTLAYDRHTKGPLYADSGVPEYWIVNLVDGVVEVYLDPTGGTYTTISRHRRGEELPVPAFADVRVALDEFLPPP